MKKLILISAVLLTLLGVVWFSFPVKANPSAVQVYTNDTAGANSKATSSAPYLVSGAASSTMAFDPANGRAIQVFIASYATNTSAAPIVNFEFQFSNNNSDWYPFQTVSSGFPATLKSGVGGHIWVWTMSTTTINETAFLSVPTHLDNYNALYGRVVYSVKTGSTNLHLEVAQRKEF
jgi:hypothetical protein